MNTQPQTITSIPQTFKKDERLCSKKIIEELFKKNHSHFIHPFKVIWIETELPTTYPAQLIITVSKRHYKKAVDRNYIKRLVRESYRKNKYSLYESLTKHNKQYAIAVICVAQEKLTYTETEKKIILLLQILNNSTIEHS